VRDAWIERNYDKTKMKFYTNESGFILGQSKLGESKLGLDGAKTEIPATFTSINITEPCSTDGLFAYKEVRVCDIKATLPDKLDLMGERLSVEYNGYELFKGTVREFSASVSSSGGKYWLPGNTETKTYDVSLRVTAGEEEFSDAVTPTTTTIVEDITFRIYRFLGLPTYSSEINPADDINPSIYTNIYNIATVYRAFGPEDDPGSLADTVQDFLKILNLHYVYKPWDQKVELRSNARWHSGTAESDALLFTDDAADDTKTGGDAFTHNDRAVAYSSYEEGYDRDLYVGSAQVHMSHYTTGVETTVGPYQANTVNPSNPTVELGRLTQPGLEIGRNYIATLPLKNSPQKFVKSIEMPLQSYKQLDAQVPGMALLKNDGVTERVAVLGVTHSITQDDWHVSYTLGPHHLLDRESDYDPGCPTEVTGSRVGSAVTLQWKTPNLPADVTLYRYVYSNPDSLLNVASWTTGTTIHHVQKVTGENKGDLQTANFTNASSETYYVAYTSDPNPGSGVANGNFRQGQFAVSNFF
jgi:hypothetical protein